VIKKRKKEKKKKMVIKMETFSAYLAKNLLERNPKNPMRESQNFLLKNTIMTINAHNHGKWSLFSIFSQVKLYK
jgi:hypothetical protein